jgi:hypothetical protein
MSRYSTPLAHFFEVNLKEIRGAGNRSRENNLTHRKRSVNKWLLGLGLGGLLGIFDGLTAPLSAPETAPQLLGIVIGSMVKGCVAGVLIGLFAQKVQSLVLGIVFGLAVGALLAFGIVMLQYSAEGKWYLWQIMLPGSVVGLVVGYVTQQYGRRT